MNDYKKRFVEVDEILSHMPQKEFDKIPKEIISLIRKNKDLNYIWKYDNNKSLKEQKIHKDTIHILSYINTEFILEGEQRKIIKKFHILNEMKNETLKKQKYNPENIFKKTIKSEGCIYENRDLSISVFSLVRMKGLEPPRRWHWFLRPARLPVPPHPHLLLISNNSYISTNSLHLSIIILYFFKTN